jgi:D-glycero-D-manno-heptose 1,7-bisphosphate phosphatase
MKVAFLDRDGVINVDHGYTYKIESFEFVDGCVEALQRLSEAGFAIIVVTNQSGIGRGYYTEQDYQQLTQWYRQQLAECGVDITDVFHCPHEPEASCVCRKPQAGLFLQAFQHYSIDSNNSIMVGDKLSDMAAAEAAGIKKRYLVKGGESVDTVAYPIYDDLLHCVKTVLLSEKR